MQNIEVVDIRVVDVPEDADEGVQLAGLHVPVQQPADRPQLRLRGDQPGQGHWLVLSN